MNDTLTTILGKHEADDHAQVSDDSLFISAVKNEYANSDEIIDAATACGISVRDFLSGKVTDLPVVPVRRSDGFYIKKHTESQIPYFHSHEFYELIYVHKGKCIQRFKNGDALRLSEKQCSLISPGVTHLIEKSKKPDIVLKFVIPVGLFGNTGGKVLGDPPPDGVTVFEKTSGTVEFATLKLLENQSHEVNFGDLLACSYLTIIFAELVNLRKNNVALEISLNSYFEQNIKNASLEEFAKTENYNAHYMSRLIRSGTGRSFSELLSIYRINRAKRFLSESDMSIENIAAEVGYASPSGLYKQFFTVCGMKPTEYRNLFR